MPAGDMRTVGPVAPAQQLQRSSASSKRANPRDFTGRQKQQLEAQRAAELAQREREMALAAEAEAQVRIDEVVDYSEGGTSAPGVAPGTEAAVAEVVEEIMVEDPIVEIRVNSPIEDMVFGRTIDHPGDVEKGIPPVVGSLQFYSFEEGRRYRVPAALAKHLESIGYLYH